MAGIVFPCFCPRITRISTNFIIVFFRVIGVIRGLSKYYSFISQALFTEVYDNSQLIAGSFEII